MSARRPSLPLPSWRRLAAAATLLALPWPAPAAAATPAGDGVPAPAAQGETVLFDGRTLAGWKPSAFDSQTAVKVENPFRGGPGAIVLPRSTYMAGITLADATGLPRMNYELSLEAMRTDGGDFFCGLTFPIGDSAVTFVVGGWGGMVTGISCIDNSDASDNETTTGKQYENNRWYRIRVRVTPGKLEAWVDDEQVVDFETTGRKLDLRFGDISKSLPLGIAAYETGAAFRQLRLRRL
jgi:hypothetical protein